MKTHALRISIALLLAIGFSAAAALAADKTFEPFNGENLNGWKVKGAESASRWMVGIAHLDPKDPSSLVALPTGGAAGDMVNVVAHSLDIHTEKKFGDVTISLEFMVPKGANSGVYPMGEYEVQILDSYGKKEVGPGDLGGIYNVKAPKVNAAKKPGEWQSLVIEFRAPRFAGGKKTASAKFLKVVLNGEVIQENVEVKGPTGGGVTGKEHAEGPLMFQGNHGPVAFRNIKIVAHGKK
jgi:hypothetical protein